MNLSEEVPVLDRQRMRLVSVDAHRDDLALVQDDAAMLLPAGNLKALRVGEVDQLAVLFQVHCKDTS